MEQEQIAHFGVIESAGWGWVGWCLLCGHMTTTKPGPDAASAALVELCEAVGA